MDSILNLKNKKILNISSIIPLKGLENENDIVIQIQQKIMKKFNYNFMIFKSIPYTPFLLKFLKIKWRKYYEYKNLESKVGGFNVFVYPWIFFFSSNFWLNYILLPINIVYFKFNIKKKLLKNTLDCDLIFAQNNIPDAVIAYLLHKKTKKPYILNVRGDFNIFMFRLPFISKVYESASKIITHSPNYYNQCKNIINIDLILHPIDSEFYNINIKTHESTINLVTVCRLVKLKNIDLVITSLSKLKKLNYNFIFNIIGDGPEEENLKKLVKFNNLEDNVFFHGYKNKSFIKQYLFDSHVYIMPSYPETLGRSFLEAAAANCLVVGHQGTGVDGVFINNKSAIFVQKHTLFAQIKFIFDNKSVSFFENYTKNSTKIVSKLNWENITSKYNNLFIEAIKNK